MEYPYWGVYFVWILVFQVLEQFSFALCYSLSTASHCFEINSVRFHISTVRG